MKRDEQELFHALAKDDDKAYNALYIKYFPALFLYACKYVGDRDTAEDIVQDFFCRLWENRRKVGNVSSYRNYMYISIRNRCLNGIRNNREVRADGIEMAGEDDIMLEIMEREIYRKLHEAVSMLPVKCHDIYRLKLSGRSNQEIAAEMKISEETVRTQLFRGRKLLSARLISFFEKIPLFF